MERESGRVGAKVKTVGRAISQALQQARQSEIDVLSKRNFRERYVAWEDSPAHLRDMNSRTGNPITRTNGGLDTFLRCCSEAMRQAGQSEIDVLARRRFSRSQEGSGPGSELSVIDREAGDAGEKRTPHVGEICHPLVDQGQLAESSLGGR